MTLTWVTLTLATLVPHPSDPDLSDSKPFKPYPSDPYHTDLEPSDPDPSVPVPTDNILWILYLIFCLCIHIYFEFW